MSDDDHKLPPEQVRDGALDELIGRALRTDVEPLRIKRLEQFWRDQLHRCVRRRAVRRATALAAAASLLLAGWLALSGDGDDGVRRFAASGGRSAPQQNTSLPNATESSSSQANDSHPAESTGAPSSGRRPTEYERLMFIAQTQMHAAPARQREESLAQVVDRLIANLQVDVGSISGGEFASALGDFSRDDLESVLIEKLADSTGDRQVALCRLLAVYGSQRCIPNLLKLGQTNVAGDEALATIETIVGVDRWAKVARGAQDQPTRIAIARRLLTAETRPALLAFLSLVSDEMLRDDALIAASEEAELPIEPLMILLDHEQESVRLAAALTLGRMNRCEMTEALIARVSSRPSRSKEAWFALLTCRCDAADQFLAYARRSPHLLGQLNNAWLQWSRAMP